MQPFEIKHPEYVEFEASWQLMRDAVAGEDDIRARGEKYLPMKSGQAAIENPALRNKSYNAYKARAEFPEITAPTIRGAVGVMLAKPAQIDLPESMEHLRERATLDGQTLDGLHRRIATEIMTTGRYGLMPGMTPNGVPYLAGYIAESITNWDDPAGRLDYLVLDETGPVRDRETGEWKTITRYREIVADGPHYTARIWTRAGNSWSVEDEPPALTPRGEALGDIPFVFVGTNDLTPSPDDVPLYGLAKLAVRVYQLDADFRTTIHMTSEPTPWANGFGEDMDGAAPLDQAPKSIGSAVIWLLPPSATPGLLEFTGAGAAAQAAAIADALDRAASFGAQIIETGQAAESGEALRLRAASQTATLTTIALNTAAGLERALRHIAVWIGADPEQVIVTPNLEFFDRRLTPQEITALVASWQAGAVSYDTLFARLRDGGVIDEGRTADDEADAIEADEGYDPAGIIPQQPGAEGAIT